MAKHGDKIKVLVVDDSAIVRQTIKLMLENHPQIEVVGSAINPEFAVRKIQTLDPDVLLLDIRMPGLDGLTFLKSLMKQKPIPTIIFSAFAPEGSENALRALEYGAVEVIEKPKLAMPKDIEEYKARLVEAIKAASVARVDKVNIIAKTSSPDTARKIIDIDRKTPVDVKFELIAIGASTGGPEAIRYILERMDKNSPPIVIVQHMPANFTGLFSKHLNNISALEVREATNGELLERGVALVAPGGRHLSVERLGNRLQVRLHDGEFNTRHKPSVDVLFNSVAQTVGSRAIGILLTGMGNDGSSGLLKMREKGALTIAQDEETAVIFGMPKVAIEKGAAKLILPLDQMPYFLNTIFVRNKLDKN